MSNSILILPDAVANQIAAGEVIQQPASAVKELMENAIDAGAKQIDILVKEAGKNLIQITDDGKGMSPDDAVLCFERHATSKLRQAADLMQIKTMGFRGEALASIAAIAQVELVTKPQDEELGTKVLIAGSKIESTEAIVTPTGTRFSIRNIFFNVPARRKFLGSNAKQLQAIRNEFIQIALAHPELKLSLTHNGEILFQLPASNLRQRIVAIFGESLNKKLYPIEVETDLIKISGFIGDPEAAKKRSSEQYFFVNKRFIRHSYFRKAILNVYEPLTAAGMQPVFFLFFEAAADTIDVNISPTKTEVKFEHEQIIWPILSAAVKECLGKFNAVPSLDFDKEDAPQIEVFSERKEVQQPHIHYDPNYNPFQKKAVDKNWETLYKDFDREKSTQPQESSWKAEETKSSWKTETIASGFTSTFSEDEQNDALQTLFSSDENLDEIGTELFQLFGRYLLIPMGNAILLIDQHRAQIRILFEQYCKQLDTKQSFSQTLLFPEILEIEAHLKADFELIIKDLTALGFVFEKEGNHYLITAVPEHTQGLNPVRVVNDLLDASIESIPNFSNELKDKLALRLAVSTAIPYGQILNQQEMKELCRQLFHCAIQNYLPNGEKIILRIDSQEIIKRFVS